MRIVKIVAYLSAIVALPFASESVTLNPATVVQRSRTQSTAVQASLYNLQIQQKNVQAAYASFFPTISSNGSITHFLEKPTSSSSSSFSFNQYMQQINNQLPPTNQLFDAGDLTIATLLDAVFKQMSQGGHDNFYSLGFTLTQPIYAGGRLLNAYRLSKINQQSQRFTHERTVAELSLGALRLYWGYIGTLKGMESLKETRIWFENLVKDQTVLFDNGLILELDVLNSKIQLDNFKLMEIRMNNSLQVIGSSLLMLLNYPIDAEIIVDTGAWQEVDTTFLQPTAEQIARRVDEREDIKAITSQAEALQCVRKIQTAAYLPMVAGVANVGFNNQYSSDETSLKRSTTVGVTFNWTLMDWGKSFREREKTDYQLKMVDLQLRAMRRQVELKIKELAAKVSESIDALTLAREDVTTATKALEIARKKYDAQTITNTELLNTRNQLTNKMLGLTQARINVIVAMEEYAVAPLSPSGGAAASSASSGAASGSGSN
ncbi:MAG: TolC family protein [Chitinivibrionales bacterium]|nr:TolC family protein [Chitinivibrionales bacterium]